MPKELKKYALTAAPRPIVSGRYKLVINTVSVSNELGIPGYAYVSFSDALVEDVGRLLGGVMEEDPAFLFVSLLADSFYVYARKPSGASKLLFAGEDHPEWLKFHKLKVKKHVEKKEAPDRLIGLDPGPEDTRYPGAA